MTIRNDTRIALYYDVRWGDGEWQSIRIAPGGGWTHWWPYSFPNENQSPSLQIQFDSDLSGDTAFQIYNLEPYATPFSSGEGAHAYRFQTVANGQAVELYSNN